MFDPQKFHPLICTPARWEKQNAESKYSEWLLRISIYCDASLSHIRQCPGLISSLISLFITKRQFRCLTVMLSLTAAAPLEPRCHNQQTSDGICAATGETYDTVFHTAFLSSKQKQYWQNLPTIRILDDAELVLHKQNRRELKYLYENSFTQRLSVDSQVWLNPDTDP